MTAPEPTPLERGAEAHLAAYREWNLTFLAGQPVEPASVYVTRAALAALLAGGWLERTLGEHSDFTYVDTPADPAHFVCDCGHAFGYEDGAHAEWEAHLAAAIRTAAGVGL